MIVFFNDLNRLSNKDIEIFEKKRKKILQNPKRQKHLQGVSDCYREPITKNIRVVYFLYQKTIWFLTIGTHDKAYEKFKERLDNLRVRYRL